MGQANQHSTERSPYSANPANEGIGKLIGFNSMLYSKCELLDKTSGRGEFDFHTQKEFYEEQFLQ
jgi:hypothetical protein